MSPVPSIFALDFGTTNSLLAAAAPGQAFDPVPLDPLAPDPTVLRTALHFTTADDVVFGQEALRRYFASGLRGRLLRSIKRHLSSPSFEATRIGGRRVSIENIAAAFLRAMRDRACRFFELDIDRVLLGRPARFSERADEDALAQSRLEQAARLAGFREITFCYEPVAAAYDFAAGFEGARVVLIADLGGGTSDFTIAHMKPREFHPDDVLAVGGVSVAGDALDGALVRGVVAPHMGSEARYRVPMGTNVLTMPGELLRLLCSPAHLTAADQRSVLQSLEGIRRGLLDEADSDRLSRYSTLIADNVGFQFYESVEEVKVQLSRAEQGRLTLGYPGIDLDESITRPQFEASVTWPLERILSALDRTVAAAGLAPTDIEIACLTGGTSLVPILEASLRSKLKAAQIVRLRSHHSVVQGLARCAQAQEEGVRSMGQWETVTAP